MTLRAWLGLSLVLTGCNLFLPSRDAACIATPESATVIADGLRVQGGWSLRNAFAIALPPEYSYGFVVAAEVDGPGMEGDGEIGTWAVGALGDGPIYSTNALAHNVSLWDEAEEGSPADLGRDEVAASDEAARAEACVSGG